jgi:hypothetical protein
MGMEPRELEIGDVVQIDPSHNSDFFGGRLVVVTEPKPWGMQGYVHGLEKGMHLGFVRCKWEHMQYVGRATWMAARPSEAPGTTDEHS